MTTPTPSYPDENQGPAILGATLTVTIAAFITLITRLFVRFKMIKNAGWDDHVMIMAMSLFFMGVYTVGCFLTIVLQCTNLAVLWDRNAEGTCWGNTTLKALSYTNVSLNILTDILFSIVIPIPMLWSTQMNSRQKTSLLCILGLGIFATAAALVKTSFLPNYGHSGDWLWDSRNLTIWTVIESNIGIVAGNLPCMKPLFRTVLGSTYGRGSRKTTAPSNYLSRPYGPGTKHYSVRNYNELASNKTHDGDFGAYGASEAIIMITIGVDKEDRSGSREVNPGRNSAESVAWLNDQHVRKFGGITKTTEVTHITGSARASEIYEEGMKPERREVHMV